MDEQVKVDWERCVAFHGHICPGLAIGFQATQIALKVLPALEGEAYNPKSGIVSIVQNDALQLVFRQSRHTRHTRHHLACLDRLISIGMSKQAIG